MSVFSGSSLVSIGSLPFFRCSDLALRNRGDHLRRSLRCVSNERPRLVHGELTVALELVCEIDHDSTVSNLSR